MPTDPTVLDAIAEGRINTSLLLRTLAQIEAEPDLWDQAHWRSVELDRCQTPLCFAGWSAQLAGGQWARTGKEAFYLGGGDFLLYDETVDRHAFVGHIKKVIDLGGAVGLTYEYDKDEVPVVSAEGRALVVLGLNYDQGRRLFNGENTLADIRREVMALCHRQWADDAKEAGFTIDGIYSADDLKWGPPFATAE